MNDATSIHSTLMANRLYGRDAALMRTSTPITHDTATADDVLSALGVLADGPADLIWFSFSGHGLVAKGGLQLLLPLWARSRSPRYSIGATALDAVLRQHRHKRFIVVLDACQTGAFGMRDIEPARISQTLSTPGVVVLSSCGHDQLASDGNVAGGLINGLFTHCLLTLLRSHQQANTALSALRLFIDAATLMRHQYASTQRPTLYANGLVDDFTVLLGDDPASAVSASGTASAASALSAAHG